MERQFVSFLAVMLLTFAPAALADQVSFSFNGGGITSSGTLTISETATPGYDAITSITGTFVDTNVGISGAITGLYLPISYVAPPVGSPAATPAGITYDDMFFPAGNSPNDCPDYPFFGGVFDVYGIAFNVAGGYVGELWSDGVRPGTGLVYAAGDANATTLLDLPNQGGVNHALPVGVPGTLVTSITPEPASVFIFGLGLIALSAFSLRGSKKRSS